VHNFISDHKVAFCSTANLAFNSLISVLSFSMRFRIAGSVDGSTGTVTCLDNLLKGADPYRGCLHPTIYLSDNGVTSRLHGRVGRGSDSEDMVTVAMRINFDTLNNVKVIHRLTFPIFHSI
jgi:hypothetical protein